jgi:hypothetical protein
MAGNCTTIAMLKQSEGLAFLKSSGMDYLAMDQQGTIHVNDPRTTSNPRADFPFPSTLFGAQQK